ncbi:MAG: hypothetical protein RLZZ338_459 [Cyanobacteriota bacterium]|jgi:hypothetical protein
METRFDAGASHMGKKTVGAIYGLLLPPRNLIGSKRLRLPINENEMLPFDVMSLPDNYLLLLRNWVSGEPLLPGQRNRIFRRNIVSVKALGRNRVSCPLKVSPVIFILIIYNYFFFRAISSERIRI